MELEIDGQPGFRAKCRDLGIGEAFLVATERAAVGTTFTLHVTRRRIGDSVALTAIVRWARPDGMGIEWSCLLTQETRSLLELMKRA